MSAETRRSSPLGAAARVLGLLAAAAFVALLVYGLAARSADTTIDDALGRGQAVSAPGFALKSLTAGTPGPLEPTWRRVASDGRVSLGELKGIPVVLNFWASWCIPCREEAPVLERGWQAARERGVLFVGLNMQDVREDAMTFIRDLGQHYPTIRDPTNDIARRWGVTGIPETFFISRAGRITGHVIGAVTDQQLSEGVSAAISGRPRGADQGGARRPTR